MCICVIVARQAVELETVRLASFENSNITSCHSAGIVRMVLIGGYIDCIFCTLEPELATLQGHKCKKHSKNNEQSVLLSWDGFATKMVECDLKVVV